MSSPLYRERQAGPAPRVHDVLPEKTKIGLAALLHNSLNGNWLANAFPQQCPDGRGVSGTIAGQAISMMEAMVPDLEWPPTEGDDDGVFFDLVEYFAARVETPTPGRLHDFYGHKELEFDRATGLQQFCAEVNALLAAGRTVYEITDQGKIERVGTPEIHAVLTDLRPKTGDAHLDTLIIDARQLYLSPSDTDRQIGLEKMWDALERLKTIEAGKDKKDQIQALLQHIGSVPLRDEIDSEMKALSKIGNGFQIRHHETSKHPVPDSKARDYLFARIGGLIIFLLKVSDRLDA